MREHAVAAAAALPVFDMIPFAEEPEGASLPF